MPLRRVSTVASGARVEEVDEYHALPFAQHTHPPARSAEFSVSFSGVDVSRDNERIAHRRCGRSVECEALAGAAVCVACCGLQRRALGVRCRRRKTRVQAGKCGGAVDDWYVCRLNGIDDFALRPVSPPRVLRHAEASVYGQALC
eukprot:6208941-Pleurochrysis_carterae.AAC.2